MQCGTGDKEPQTEAVAQLAQELYNTNLLISLIANLQKIDFEVHIIALEMFEIQLLPSCCKIYCSALTTPLLFALWFLTRCSPKGKKDVVHLFSNIVRRQIGARTPTVEYISSHSQILFMLLKGWVSRPQGIVIDQHFQKPLISLAFPIDVMGDWLYGYFRTIIFPFPVHMAKLPMAFHFYSTNISSYWQFGVILCLNDGFWGFI